MRSRPPSMCGKVSTNSSAQRRRSTAAPTVMRLARGSLNYNSSRERWRPWKTVGRRCSMRKFETTSSKRELAFGWGATLNWRFRTLFLQ